MRRPRRPPPLPVRVGCTIARLRKEQGYSQERFADVMGVHRTYMGHLERGERDFRLSTLERVAAALDMTAGQLLRMAEGGS